MLINNSFFKKIYTCFKKFPFLKKHNVQNSFDVLDCNVSEKTETFNDEFVFYNSTIQNIINKNTLSSDQITSLINIIKRMENINEQKKYFAEIIKKQKINTQHLKQML